MNDISKVIDDLSPNKQALLALRLKKSGGDFNSFPLSFAQQRLWFLDRLNPGSSTYHIFSGFRINGHVNLGALEQSLNEILRRHEILRTSFITVKGRPAQLIAPSLSLQIRMIDLSGISTTEHDAEILRLAQHEARRPFDLGSVPLLRFTLVHLGQQEHMAMLNMHHIISDGWSMGVLFREMGLLYEAFSTGSPSPLPELAVQYADFAQWQRQLLRGTFLEKKLAYWKEKLGGPLPVLQWPTEHTRPPVWSSRGATKKFVLAEALSESLKSLSQRHGVTLFMTLLAAFKTLLYRYTGQPDIIIGTPIANRSRSEAEELIGFFVNTIVLRTKLSGNSSFTELLAAIREAALGAFLNQEIPFEMLVSELRLERDLSRTPLFQVMFALQVGQQREVPASRDFALTPLDVGVHTANFDLNLNMVSHGQELSGWLTYSTDLFDDATIERMLRHFDRLLWAIAANPQQRLSEIPMLTEPELNQLLVAWNDSHKTYPDGCVHELIEAQAERTPDAIAVVFEDEQLTYAELNERANQLAHYLRSMGVGPGVLVGVHLERSLEMIVGLLGILKAGAAYVPLDPAHPKERLAFMLEDAQVSAVLTSHPAAIDIALDKARVICLDVDREAILRCSKSNLTIGVSRDELAYMIYTSGSTGKPKGVMVSHRNVVNFLAGMDDCIGSDQAGVWLAVTSISFDISVLELFWTLARGFKVIILPETARALSPTGEGHDGKDFSLSSLIQKHHVSHLQCTPSMARILAMETEPPDYLRSLQKLMIGGETLPAELVNQLRTKVKARIFNMYGPTETTIWSATYSIDEVESTVPIGQPIANTDLYILDAHLQPVVIGGMGELYIGGEGVTRGYFGGPELTAERFIPAPFGKRAGARLYKTGDLARYKPDGNIMHLGRLDHQVKIRGFRIELGEIEAMLNQHENVMEAAVAAFEGADGKRLTGYVVLKEKQASAINELRDFLRNKLPEYMVPSSIVALDRLPLTPNGKLDRNHLPPPDQSRPDLQQAFLAPHDILELEVAEIWEDVLNVRSIGVKDHFFEMGGDSILAVHLMFRIEQKFGRRVPLAALFQGPTVEHLANILRRQSKPDYSYPLVAIQSRGTRKPFFAVHPMGGQVLCYYHLARLLDAGRPFYGLQAPDLAEAGRQESDDGSIEEMAARYIRAIKTVQPSGPYLLGGLSFGGVVAFEMAQQLQRQAEPVALLALLDAPAPIQQERRSDAVLLAGLVGDLAIRAGREFIIAPDELESLSPDEQLSYVLEKAGRSGLVPVDVGPDVALPWMRNVLKAWHRRRRAIQEYVPQVYPDRITLLRCREERPTHPEAKAVRKVAEFQIDDPTKGWGKLSSKPVEVHVSSGYHVTMLLEPHVQRLAELLEDCIQQAEAEYSL